MQIDIEKQNGLCILHIAGDLTLPHVGEAKDSLLDALAGCRELEFNLSQVSELDSAGLQLLIMAKRQAAARGKKLRLTGHSQIVIDVLETVNLVAYFGDPMVLSA